MTKRELIIDTDPGCDDVLALLLALSWDPQDVAITLITVTYGNVAVKTCLQNLVSMFHVIEQERKWRQAHGLPNLFPLLSESQPLVAAGARGPLAGQKAQADYYHGIDGLGGVSSTHPHFTAPSETWSHLFDPSPPTPPSNDPITISAVETTHENPPPFNHFFRATKSHAVNEILSLLSSNPQDTFTLLALGPLTNFALAAAADPITFLRAKGILVMGGAIDVPGNITPVGEFNCLADPIAAARVYALTSPNPMTTMPIAPTAANSNAEDLPPYPSAKDLGERRLKLTVFPLDITNSIVLRKHNIDAAASPLLEKGSPMAEWVYAFLSPTFRTNSALQQSGEAEMALHDPLVVWYALSGHKDGWHVQHDQDVRIETTGQWTRGMHVVDRRGRRQLEEKDDLEESLDEVSGDKGHWLSRYRGNRVGICTKAPGGDALEKVLVTRIFGVT